MRTIRGLTLATLIFAGLGLPGRTTAAAAPGPVDMARRAEELKALRWGMFICWSFSTFSGREWTPGIADATFFKATGCDTEQWARTAKEACMGYILFLTKHHDGFCLWDTRTTERKVTRSPLGRDVLAELRRSCDRHGIRLALYFSEGDWTWPGAVDGKGWKAGVGRNPEMKKAQLRELLTQYGPIEYLWFDHAVGDGGLSHADTAAFCKALQPGCFVGFNHGDQHHADIRLGEMGRPGPLDDPAAAGPHMKDPPGKNYRLAEFTYPILPPHKGGAMWFYSLPIHDELCHQPEKLHADYLGAVRFGNVFALDVGPDFAGRLRAVDVRTLRKVGDMIRAGNPSPPAPASAGAPARSAAGGDAPSAKDKGDRLIEERYAALVAGLPPDQQAWERILQENLGNFYLPRYKAGRVQGVKQAWDYVRDAPGLPRVLLIGDSVSRGYTLAAREALAGKANVHRAPANCGGTALGLAKIDTWLGTGRWDLIHFNFGIHDRATPVAEYTRRLETLVTRIVNTGAKLVWASTTPIPDIPDRNQRAAAIVERNAAAAALMRARHVTINDLFAFITPHLAQVQPPQDVHFNQDGYRLLGRHVAATIEAALGKTAGASGQHRP